MGIFDFFKKKQEQRQKIKIQEIDNWLIEKNKEIENIKESSIQQIKHASNNLISELNQNILKLKSISLDNKKTEERLKLVVKDNLEKYISNLNSMIKEIELIDSTDYHKIIIKLDLIISNFKKRSLMHYEKATILIGNELESTKNNLSKFSVEVNRIINENKKIIDNKNINEISEEILSLKTASKLIQESDEKILIFNEKIKFLEEEISNYLNSIESLKNSNEYKIEIKQNTDICNAKLEKENKINDLKDMIDFKELSKNFHSDAKKMKIINGFKDNFKDSFEKDIEKLISLLIEFQGKNDKIQKSIEEINLLSEKIKEQEVNKIRKISEEISKINYKISKNREEITSLKQEIIQEEKKKMKFRESKIIISDKLKSILMSMNIELI